MRGNIWHLDFVVVLCRLQAGENELTSWKSYLHGVLPFVPVIVGVSLKFALIDQPGAYVFSEYVRPAWIEFLVTAYVTGVAALLARSAGGRTMEKLDIFVFIAFPAICFVICLVLMAGTAKAGVNNDFLQVYLPASLAAISLAICGGRIGS
jgi:hypothetical protein